MSSKKRIGRARRSTEPGYVPERRREPAPREEPGSGHEQLVRWLRQCIEVRNKPKQYVFLVQGHDHGTKETVARLIEHLGLSVIILHENPNEGRTIIEKLEAHSNATYAVVLLTADDVGGSAAGVDRQARARQNVVFELGYFTARLGRSKVCILFEEGVELPSDFSGVLHITLDPAGAWRYRLALELKRAGQRVDLNAIGP